jgi:nitrite reductase/ring-hydroxylating ferredoxin subunit
MERREFLKASCSYCLAASTGLIVTSLSSCTAPPMLDAAVIDNRITVPHSAFARSDYQILRPSGLLFDIGLHRESDGTFRALLLQCTHASTQLTPTGDGYTCPAHGSTFDVEGRVTRGPAQLPLRELPTEQSQDTIIVRLH